MRDSAFHYHRPIPAVRVAASVCTRTVMPRTGRTFHLKTRELRHGEKFKAQVVAAYQDRLSIRGVTRTFGVCYQNIMV